MIFNSLGNLICGEEIPHFLGIFDFSTAPQFLFYSYIPIIIASALIGFYIYREDKKSLQSKLLLAVIIFFILWVLNILVQWVSSYHTILMLGWQLTAIFEVGIFLFTIYLAYVFVNKKDLPFIGKIVLWSLGMAVLVLTPSKLNITSYDIYNCEGVVGPLWDVIYILEPATVVILLYMGFLAFRKQADGAIRRQIVIFTTGLVFFLGTFFVSNFYGEITQVYEFNLWGPIGMLVFFILLGYLIVKFHVFHLKIFAAQALMVSILFLISGILFVEKIENVRIITVITIIASTISGSFLIKSVKREVEQREELAELNFQLKDLIKQRENLVHLVTHKVKGSFTRSKYIFAGMLDGTFGAISDEIKKRAEQGLESDNMGIETVDLVLSVANMQKGIVKYEMKEIDLKDLVMKTANEKKIGAEMKGLKVETEVPNDTFKVQGDVFWLKEVVNNLIENSIKYTKQGKVTVGLSKHDNMVRITVKDTGIGISEEDKKNLFTEGGRGKDSVKVNVDSTGYGLYSVKLIVDAHKGHVWGESAGAGLGSTFYVELPAA